MIKGSIVDIGGGGEGIIGRIYMAQVTAIDNRKDELDEAPGGFKKLVMDASAMEFEDGSFDNAASFYTFMFIEKEKHEKVIQEAHRVLKKGGSFHIWDSRIKTADPFVVELDIDASGERIHTTYGVYKDNAFQDENHFKLICEKSGFVLEEGGSRGDQFYLRFFKRD
ncbi:MAG: class I SAM-dependent methyltransferase [Christensenellales bacterium]